MEEVGHILQRHGYQVGKILGKGGFGTCYLVNSSKYKMQFACKVIFLNEKSRIARRTKTYRAEIEALSRIDNPNIIRIYDFFEEENQLFIILEYCSNGSIVDILKKYKRIKKSDLRTYLKQMTSALDFCHKNHLSHMDIKPGNILLTAGNTVKIADFGLSMFMKEGSKMKDFSGSHFFEAPEIIDKKEFDPFKADVWSFGVTVYLMACGEYPFDTLSTKVIKSQLEMGIEMPSIYFPPDIKNIVVKCLKFNPLHRPSFEEIHGMIATELPEISRPILQNPTAKRSCLIPKRRSPSTKPIVVKKSISSLRLTSKTPGPRKLKLQTSKTSAHFAPQLCTIDE